MNEADLGTGALAGIAVASVGAAVLALLVVRRWSDQEALARAKASAQAHLLEFRLFMDDPLAILRSQRALLSDNLRILMLLLKPFAVLAVPMLVLMWQLDAWYGRAPLRIGEATVVSWPSDAASIDSPEGIAIETRPVHVRATGETSWRIRPLRKTSGVLRVSSTERRIVAGGGIAYLPVPLLGRNRPEIRYPRATVSGLHWLVWFVLLSTIAAFALRRPLRVVF